MGMTTTVTLEPDPIPLDVKVVLFGDRTLYYLLASIDPDRRTALQGARGFRRRRGSFAGERGDDRAADRLDGGGDADLKPLDRGGVARVIEHAARLADDASKLTLLVESIHDSWSPKRRTARSQAGARRGDAGGRGRRRSRSSAAVPRAWKSAAAR